MEQADKDENTITVLPICPHCGGLISDIPRLECKDGTTVFFCARCQKVLGVTLKASVELPREVR